MARGIGNFTRREILGALAGLATLGMGVEGADKPASLAELYDKAISRLSLGENDEGLEMFLQMETEFPSSADAYFTASNSRIIGLTGGGENRVMGAVKGYTKAMTLEENFAEAMVNWAVLSFIVAGPSFNELKGMADSFYQSEFRKPYELKSTSPLILVAANKVMDEAIKLRPRLFSARFNKGQYLLYSGMPREAVPEFSKAIEIGLKDEDWSGHTPTFKEERSTEVAISTHPLYINSALMKHYIARFRTYKIDGETLVLLSDDFEGIHFQSPNTPLASAYYCRGVCHAHLGDYAKTIADCSESVRLNPRIRPYLVLSTAQRLAGNERGSRETIEKLNAYSERMNRLLVKKFETREG